MPIGRSLRAIPGYYRTPSQTGHQTQRRRLRPARTRSSLCRRSADPLREDLPPRAQPGQTQPGRLPLRGLRGGLLSAGPAPGTGTHLALAGCCAHGRHRSGLRRLHPSLRLDRRPGQLADLSQACPARHWDATDVAVRFGKVFATELPAVPPRASAPACRRGRSTIGSLSQVTALRPTPDALRAGTSIPSVLGLILWTASSTARRRWSR